MTVFERPHMPSLAGATVWLQSEPLGPPELRGHVVLVNFWTLTCINWLRQEPYVRAWSQAYRSDGLLVIGVHTPEFSFEHEIDRVRRALTDRGIDYPVAVDNDYAIWSAFENHSWPALYFIDTDGSLLRERRQPDRHPAVALSTGTDNIRIGAMTRTCWAPHYACGQARGTLPASPALDPRPHRRYIAPSEGRERGETGRRQTSDARTDR
jgi:thiol-disulfide isomerase/thioredoxin